MNEKKWIVSFSGFFIATMLVLISVNLFVDPFQTFNMSWKLKYSSDRNANLAKLTRLIVQSETESLIVGSSRSEYFLPSDIKTLTGLNSFSTSVPGAKSFEKYAFSMFGLDNLENLKEIIYAVDFYEFNKSPIPSKLLYLNSFNHYFDEAIFNHVRPASMNLIKSLLSMVTLKASYKNIKEYFKGKKTFYNSDGSTTRSLNIYNTNDFNKRVDDSIKQYFKGEWLNFRKLSIVSFQMMERLIVKARKKGVQIKFIITPLHPRVQRKIQVDEVLSVLHAEFIGQMMKYSTDSNEVWNFSDSEKFLKPNNTDWSDGAHITREGSLKLLQIIEKK